MNVKMIIGLAILTLCFGSGAQAFSLSMDENEVILTFGENVSLIGWIMNESEETECLDVSAETNDERIGARADMTRICLDAGESRDLKLDFTNYGDAEEGTYFAEVAISGDSGFFRKAISVVVRENDHLAGTDEE